MAMKSTMKQAVKQALAVQPVLYIVFNRATNGCLFCALGHHSIDVQPG